MFCGKCGNAIPEGNTFCGKCGTPVDPQDLIRLNNVTSTTPLENQVQENQVQENPVQINNASTNQPVIMQENKKTDKRSGIVKKKSLVFTSALIALTGCLFFISALFLRFKEDYLSSDLINAVRGEKITTVGQLAKEYTVHIFSHKSLSDKAVCVFCLGEIANDVENIDSFSEGFDFLIDTTRDTYNESYSKNRTITIISIFVGGFLFILLPFFLHFSAMCHLGKDTLHDDYKASGRSLLSLFLFGIPELLFSILMILGPFFTSMKESTENCSVCFENNIFFYMSMICCAFQVILFFVTLIQHKILQKLYKKEKASSGYDK